MKSGGKRHVIIVWIASWTFGHVVGFMGLDPLSMALHFVE